MIALPALIATLPKIELHRHLEGSLRLTTLIDLARQHKISVPRTVDGLRPLVQVTPESPYTFEHFLSKFATLRKFFLTPEIIQRVAREAVEDAAEDNVRYMELRFTPKALANASGFDFSDVIGWVCQAVDEAQVGRNITVRLIVSINRHESPAIAEKAIRAAYDYRDKGVVGIDMAGLEAGYDYEPFRGIFHEAHTAGLGVTVHAGEWAGPENVQYAIETLAADRIGHGVRVIEAPQIAALARDRAVAFEVCVTSNIHSGVSPSLWQHPLRRMMALGLHTTLNTDDPLLSNITLSDELLAAVRGCGVSVADLRQMTLNAAHCAFLPPPQRAELVAEMGLAFEQVT